jgi:predicted helicase
LTAEPGRSERLAQSEQRIHGIYPTPQPLIDYIVRSVQILLRAKLGMPGGLADPGVRLLDPAAGAMSFIRSLGPDPLNRFLGIELLEPEIRKGHAERTAVCADALAPAPEILHRSFNVVIGNPPWRGRSSHRGPWISGLLREYFQVDGQSLGERNPKWLNDDYVKFLRLAQWLIERNGEGMIGFVLNHNFLDAPTFRGLRRSLLRAFHEIYVLDLHGNARKRERGNVFSGVAQGAAILLLVKKPGLRRRVLRADLDGSRRDKLSFLSRSDIGTTPWTEVEPRAPGYLFVAGDRAVEREFRQGLALPEIFPVHGTGIVTGQDAAATALDRDVLRNRFGADHEDKIMRFLARPFDLRFIVYTEGIVERPRRGLMSHMLDGGNVGLIVTRQCKGEPGALVTRWLAGHKVLCGYDSSSLFPLYLSAGAERRPNLAADIRQRCGDLYGAEPEPEAILGYVYAVLYSETYRQRYRDLLRRSFPRINFPRDRRLFAALSGLGRELIGLHLLQDPRLQGLSEAIDPRVWNYRIGAYPVLSRWLKARNGRALNVAEAREFRRIAEALRWTLAAQAKIEEVLID